MDLFVLLLLTQWRHIRPKVDCHPHQPIQNGEHWNRSEINNCSGSKSQLKRKDHLQLKKEESCQTQCHRNGADESKSPWKQWRTRKRESSCLPFGIWFSYLSMIVAFHRIDFDGRLRLWLASWGSLNFPQPHVESLLVGEEGDLCQGEGHREDHPDVNHLDIGGRRQRSRDSDEAGTKMHHS